MNRRNRVFYIHQSSLRRPWARSNLRRIRVSKRITTTIHKGVGMEPTIGPKDRGALRAGFWLRGDPPRACQAHCSTVACSLSRCSCPGFRSVRWSPLPMLPWHRGHVRVRVGVRVCVCLCACVRVCGPCGGRCCVLVCNARAA